MKLWLTFLSVLPGTLLTVLVAVTAALRFYEPADFSLQFTPEVFREWSLWAFAATLLVAVVDLGLKWFNGNVARNREDQARNREIEREQRQDRRDIALLTYLADPTPENQVKLRAICQEIENYPG
ncbi:hypothetical protein [Synechococcus sp. PCC 6312]|uniref:hypothetical protein n=1 Tax=Synechococcus sp. (strain ATCC 27167 / PCC 6312) TaxID=195253 RepID=UPI00029EDEA1|nr:hypothetical protein [Synechococcus sp. PCC 6312]AFY60792.1 hypothetical protein Syn6312_1633 [Synechococcus sp. PCC 6312]